MPALAAPLVPFLWLLGGARLVFSPAPEKSARVATIAWPEGTMGQPEFLRALEPNLSNDERDKLTTAFARIHDHFIEATRRADRRLAGGERHGV
jgi:hypothetical protein